MDELLTEFLTETSEALAVIDNELVRFEQDPSDKAILQDIFRLVHTIKGTSGFLGLPRLESVTHAGEDVLGLFRDGTLEVTPQAVSLILKAIDRVKDIIAGLEESGSEPAGDDTGLIAELRAMADGDAAPAAAPAAPAPQASAPAESAPPSDPDGGFPVAQELLDEVAAAGGDDSGAPTSEDGGFPVAQELLDEVAAAGGGDVPTDVHGGFPVAQELLDEVASARGTAQSADGTGEHTEGLPAGPQPPAPVAEAPAAAAAPKAPAQKPAEKPAPAAAEAEEPRQAKESSIAAQSVRVNVQLLENLMTLVGELVLTRNQLLQMVRGRDDSEFKVPLQRLNHITTDVQEGVMKTRMQPIQNAWAKLPRIVRDLSMEMDKKIDLRMLGGETELDRQVLELIKDPLMHMVRNSADHGLETTEGRLEAGKPETGVITLNAYHEGGHIIIEISDDGRGVNIERVKANILSKELATEADLAEMSDQQITQFIFKAGFSTAEKITSVSGRGVGMDVVRTNIEKIGGNVELTSETGKGSRFKINIPLTLAIVSALIVESGGERFAIPQIGVLELVRVSDNSENRIEKINDVPVLRLRDRLLPLVDLPKLQKLRVDGEIGSEISQRYVVVSQVGTFIFGLIVDRVFDTEEIVVKPVAPILRQIPIYSGNTILGDGSVIMILDVNGIASSAGAVDVPRNDADDADQEAANTGAERIALLVFRAAGSELRAVPLALVSRLEIIEGSRIEFAHGAAMVQYRNRLMPLIATDGKPITADGQKNLLVFQEGDRAAGLVVEEIVDIVEENLKVELTANQPGLVGTAVIDGKATDVLDVGHYLTQAFPDWFSGTEEDRKGGEGSRKRMLLVDDSPFFRNLMAPLFSVAGYEVITADSADDALRMRDDGADFDVIISDIEMPGTDGFQFAEHVRGDPRWKDVPMVALSSRASDKDRERGRAVGFDDYVAKFDRNKVLDSLNRDFRRDADVPTEKVA
jgi:two-component system, chemotaxis family, sensor kinase CheA